MPVSETRLLMISSISANEDAIKPRDLLDGRPGFFGASDDVGVKGRDVLTTTMGVDDSDVDANSEETGGIEENWVGFSGPPAGFTTIEVGMGTGAGGSEGLSNTPPGSGTFVLVAGGGA
jgi:hypothetical protein